MKLEIYCKNCDMKMTIDAKEVLLKMFSELYEYEFCCDSPCLAVKQSL